MFEKMSQARFTRRLVGGAYFVPDHVRDHWRAMIRHHDDFKPVRQGKMADVCAGMGACSRAHKRGNEQRDLSYLHLRLALIDCAAPGHRLRKRKRYRHTLSLKLHALAQGGCLGWLAIRRNSVWLIRGWRLVARRWIGQAGPRRLACECSVFFFSEPVEVQKLVLPLWLDSRGVGRGARASFRNELIRPQRPAFVDDAVALNVHRLFFSGLPL